MNRKVILTTGYEVDLEDEEGLEHLFNAIFGEVLTNLKDTVNGGVKVTHLAEQKCTTHSLYSRDRPGCQYLLFAGSFIPSG